MEIYADVIFFVNFIFSYVLLYILGKFVNTVKIKKLRLAVAAVIGGISSAIIFCIEMPMWISYVLRCVAMFLMITTAYFEKPKQMMTTTTRCLTTHLANRFTRVPPFELHLIIEHHVDFINDG